MGTAFNSQFALNAALTVVQIEERAAFCATGWPG
jgi:hypothetical protein